MQDLNSEVFRLDKDFGHSILRMKYLEFILTFDRIMKGSYQTHKSLLQSITDKYLKTLQVRANDDNELFRILLSYWNKYLKHVGQQTISEKDKTELASIFCILLSNKDFV
jgi:hypothetical protein